MGSLVRIEEGCKWHAFCGVEWSICAAEVPRQSKHEQEQQ